MSIKFVPEMLTCRSGRSAPNAFFVLSELVIVGVALGYNPPEIV